MTDHSMSDLYVAIQYLIMQSWDSDLPNDGDGYHNFDENGVMQTSPEMYLCIYGHYI
jgi:hypothetical protein